MPRSPDDPATDLRHRRPARLLATALLPAALLAAVAAPPAGATTIGAEVFLPLDPRSVDARYTRFRPGQAQTVHLNPPRFSWPYDLGVVVESAPPGRTFTLQVAADDGFAEPVIEVAATPWNFYNFLPPLPRDTGTDRWYWRVGYEVGTGDERWSAPRWFRLAPGARAWDRSGIPALLDRPRPHPRLFLDAARLGEIADLALQDDVSAGLWQLLVDTADETLELDWYAGLPADDCPPGTPQTAPSCDLDFGDVGRRLAAVAFVWKLTGDDRYAGVLDRALTLASYPPGGWASPEGTHPRRNFDGANHLVHYLAAIYDWHHDRLSPAERRTLREAVEWRIERLLDARLWSVELDGADRRVRPESLAMIGWSHHTEALAAVVIGALAIHDESAVAREALELGLSYLIGVTNAFGEDEGWNEGPGYGNSKMNELLSAVAAVETVLPELDLAANLDVLGGYMEFFRRVTPLGAEHSAFGNRSNLRGGWLPHKIRNARFIGLLRGDGPAWRDFGESRRLFDREGYSRRLLGKAWIDYALRAWFPDTPLEANDRALTALYPVAGWVTVTSEPPADLDAQQEAVSMTFQARPRGAYSHSFAADGAFDLHAYGETVAVGGGSTDNHLDFPRRSISHNTVLVDGEGQLWDQIGDYRNPPLAGPQHDRDHPVRARVVAFAERTVAGTPATYWAADLTDAYPAEANLGRFLRHVVFVDGAWFAVFDDLATADGTPGTFQWLYHVHPAETVPLELHRPTGSFEYTKADVSVLVRHLARPEDLRYRNFPGASGQVNITKCGPAPAEGTCDEDYRFETTDAGSGRGVVDAHHLWIDTPAPTPAHTFLAAIVPWRSGLDAAPTITPNPSSDHAFTVGFRGESFSVSFDPRIQADLVIDAGAISAQAGRGRLAPAPAVALTGSAPADPVTAPTRRLERLRVGHLPDRIERLDRIR